MRIRKILLAEAAYQLWAQNPFSKGKVEPFLKFFLVWIF